jgi:manganese-dependent inorganic pyrophosphatase
VGSTSTLVALSYKQYGTEIEPPIAGLLMAGLISDTLNLTSPTVTPIDAKVLEELSKIAGTEPTKLSESIFAVGSPLLTLGPSEVILADCKDYKEDEHVFSVFADRRAGILAFLQEAEGIVRSVGGLSVKAGELFRCAFNHRCKYAELAPADFSSARVPGHNHLSKQGSEPFRA